MMLKAGFQRHDQERKTEGYSDSNEQEIKVYKASQTDMEKGGEFS